VTLLANTQTQALAATVSRGLTSHFIGQVGDNFYGQMTQPTAFSRGLTSHFIGQVGDNFYRSDDPTNSVKAMKEASRPLR